MQSESNEVAVAPTNDVTNDSHQETQSQAAPTQKRSHKKRKSGDARLRKLWRRATTTPQGITSRAEWEELAELHSEWKARNSNTDGNEQGKDKYADELPGPSVSIKGVPGRDFSRIEEWQSSKVADHRDILANLLFGGDVNSNDGNAPSKKKRKKQKASSSDTTYNQRVSVPSLPSWANISNLAAIGGVAVIEIDIHDSNTDVQSKCSLMPSEFLQNPTGIWKEMLHSNNSNEPTTNDNKQQVKRIIGAACKVKMFQGEYPRCISDELMFLPPPSATKLNGNKSEEKDLSKVMYALRLTARQMQSEGFPRRTGERVQINESSELHSKMEQAKETICTRAKSFWDEFDINKKNTTAAIQSDSNAPELVESLSVREIVCCGDAEPYSDDEFSKSEFYVQTLLHDKRRSPKVFALDCEMVQTAAGSELARVSVVMLDPDDQGRYSIDESKENTTVMLDELVKPRRPILDYLTEFSGITAAMLQDVNTRIEHIQAHILSLIQDTDLIVGHSLENDLKALRIIHTNVIDTSVIFRGGNGRKYGLRHLTNVLLKRQIQSNEDGHCSTEDAEAALVLATKRAKLGPAFQLKENSRGKSLMRAFQSTNCEAGERKESYAERSEGSCVCIGSNEWISKYAKSDGSHHVLSCDSIMNSMSMAIPSWLSSSNRRAGFLWANLTCDVAEKSGENELKKLEEITRDIHRRVPYHTPILMIFQRNISQAIDLTKDRKLALKSSSSEWRTEEEQSWQKYMDSCMAGEAIWMVGMSV